MSHKQFKKIDQMLQEVEGSGLKGKDRNKFVSMKLRAFRAKNNLTMVELAEKVGCTYMEIYRWEHARNVPSRVYQRVMVRKGILNEVI